MYISFPTRAQPQRCEIISGQLATIAELAQIASSFECCKSAKELIPALWTFLGLESLYLIKATNPKRPLHD